MFLILIEKPFPRSFRNLRRLLQTPKAPKSRHRLPKSLLMTMHVFNSLNSPAESKPLFSIHLRIRLANESSYIVRRKQSMIDIPRGSIARKGPVGRTTGSVSRGFCTYGAREALLNSPPSVANKITHEITHLELSHDTAIHRYPLRFE